MGAFSRNNKSPSGTPATHDVHTILGPESSFEGKLTFDGTVRIDGRFVGEVHTDNMLIVGPNARLEATLHVGSVIIHGEVIGNIVARHWVEIHAPAKLIGDVHSPELMIDRGVVFVGASHMGAATDSKSSATAPKAVSQASSVTLLKSADSA
jgi:cytoskeletal protein CcmA (bactofilin family)